MDSIGFPIRIFQGSRFLPVLSSQQLGRRSWRPEAGLCWWAVDVGQKQQYNEHIAAGGVYLYLYLYIYIYINLYIYIYIYISCIKKNIYLTYNVTATPSHHYWCYGYISQWGRPKIMMRTDLRDHQENDWKPKWKTNGSTWWKTHLVGGWATPLKNRS